MVYGVEFKNTGGDVIVDGTNINLGVYESGTVSWSLVDGVYWCRIDHTPCDNPPIVAIETNGNFYYPSFSRRLTDGNNQYYRFETKYASSPGPSWNYALMLPYSELVQTSGGYGLEIFDASGNAIFSSNYRNMRIRDVVTVSKPTSGNITSFTHASVTNPYYLVDGIFGVAIVTGFTPTPSRLYEAGVRSTSSTGGELCVYQTGTLPPDVAGLNLTATSFKVAVAELSY